MKHNERLLRNEIVVNLSKAKKEVSNICEIVGLKKSQVNLILQWEAENSVLSMPTKGRPPGLEGEKLVELAKFLEKGSEFYGY